jgi:hypothetical protein
MPRRGIRDHPAMNQDISALDAISAALAGSLWLPLPFIPAAA